MTTSARLSIPWHNSDNNKFIACQGRSYNLKNDKLKYQTSKVHEDTQLIFGRDRLNPNIPKFAVEKVPIDSLYVDNCVDYSLGFNKFRDYCLKIMLSNFQIMIEEIQM